jgi:hypothetical protein
VSIGAFNRMRRLRAAARAAIEVPVVEPPTQVEQPAALGADQAPRVQPAPQQNRQPQRR